MNNISIFISIISVFIFVLSFVLLILYITTSKNKEICFKNKNNKCIDVVNKKCFDVAIRIFDFVFSLMGIIILSPFYLCSILAIKFSTKKPIISKRQIVGKNAKIINLYLFTIDEECDSVSFQKFMKYSNLERLPLFLNVIKGDISLFGLSNIRNEHLESIKSEAPDILIPYSYYKPGLVSLSSLKKFDNSYSWPLFLHTSNIEFVNNRSIGLLLKMLIKTLSFTI